MSGVGARVDARTTPRFARDYIEASGSIPHPNE
jgi:hypothetical protein